MPVGGTVSNPLLKLCDIDASAAHHARPAVDNIFASPYFCRPLEHGADFSEHSATKYISGHVAAMCGVVIAKESFDQSALVSVIKLAGGILGTWEGMKFRAASRRSMMLKEDSREAAFQFMDA